MPFKSPGPSEADAEHPAAGSNEGQSDLAAALRRAEARLQAATSVETVGVVFFHPDGRITDANRAFERLSGYGVEELRALEDWKVLTAPEFHAATAQAMEELAREGRTAPYEKRMIRKDGTSWWGLFAPTRVPGSGRAGEGMKFIIDITERKRTEETLRVSEERFRTLADAVPQLIWTNDAHGYANYFNQRWYDYSGLSFEQSAGLGWQVMVHPDDAAASARRWEQAQAGGEIFDTEYRLRAADGSYRWFIGRNVPLRDAAGNATGWFGTATDVHDLKSAEAALREREEQFNRAIEDAPIPVIMHAEDGRVLQISRAWTELTGYHPADMPNFHAWLNQAYGEGAETVRDHVRRLFRGEVRVLDTEMDVTTRTGGRRRWLFSASAPGTLRSGQRFVVGTALDITERTQAEEALRTSQEQLRLIVENAREYAIFSQDLERRITSWNSGAQAILGYSSEQALGQSGDIIFTPEDRATGAPEKEAAGAINDGRAADERWHLRQDGSRFWGSGVMMAMRDTHGTAVGLLKIYRDQTAELRAREALEHSRQLLWESLQETERARAQAESANQAKDHFLAVLSHELRTPLTPILMALHTLARRDDLPPPVRAAHEMIGRNVALEAHFIDDLLDVTRIARGKIELVRRDMDLHEALQRAVEVSSPDLEAKGQTVTVTLAATRHHLHGDSARLQQVFWNLLKNASKFSPPGGAIQVLSRNEPGDWIVVEVTDPGIGLSAEAVERVFAPFEQANSAITREFGGLGLGLAISRASVEAHGGAIRAASPGIGRGATFTVSLPAQPSVPAPLP